MDCGSRPTAPALCGEGSTGSVRLRVGLVCDQRAGIARLRPDMHDRVHQEHRRSRRYGASTATPTRTPGARNTLPGTLYPVGGGRGDDHIAFVAEVTDAHIKVFHAMSPSKGVNYSTYNFPVSFGYDHGVRPLVLGGQSTATQNNDQARLVMIPPGSRYETQSTSSRQAHSYNEWGFPVLEGEQGMESLQVKTQPGTRCTCSSRPLVHHPWSTTPGRTRT